MLPEFAEPTDRFVLQDRAGAGGMGDVFRALDQESQRTVAVKVLRASAGDAERRRFQREIAVIADLRHPNIVDYVAHGTLPDHRPFYAMEWLDGEDLGQRQRHAPLGMRDSVEVIRRSAAAMAAVHARGIVHRDLKLGNIFLVRGKGTAIKLIDFGVVKLPDEELADDRGAIIGTPHFMAPEQARGEIVDARADVYSLGSALFRLVTGRSVFETEHVIALLGRLVLEDPPSPMSIRFDVPEPLSRVILQAIARSRDERFENGGELARALARVGELNNDPPATDRSASAIRRTMPEMRRPPSVEIAAIDNEANKPPPSAAASKASRRVVAAVVFRLDGRSIDGEFESELRETLGSDARVETLLGGQTVAIVGVEQSVGDEAIRAARAALLFTRHVPTASAVIAVGHAVLTAPAVASGAGRGGNLAGEALERAAKQLDVAAPGTVRADASVITFLGGRFLMTEDKLGAVLVREDQVGFGARLLLGRPTPTVGRDKEIALLTSVYGELLEEGTPRAALVTGPPGIGKSRVRAEVVMRLEASPYPPELLFARGDSMSQRSSLSAFGRAMRQVIGVHEGESLADQVEKVRAHMSFRLPKALRFLASFLGELVGVPFPDASDEPLRAARQNSQLMQSRMKMAVEAFVRAQSDVVPQVMILEDAHWADDTTLDVIEWILACPDVKFAVFVFARPDFEARVPALWKNKTLTRLTLAPLSPLAADKIVVKAMPYAEARLRTSIIERAGGNVLFLEELIRAAAQPASAVSGDLPLTVQAVVQMRLDHLASELRETVRAASVVGQVFWTGAVSALKGRDATGDLEELQAAEIVTKHVTSRVAGETEWSFRQALVREAAYASILEEDRAGYHQQAGSWLEAVGDADMGLLAKHADAGKDFERAATLYAGATRQAYTNGAHLETALELAERGLGCIAQLHPNESGAAAAPGVKAQLLLAAAQARLPLGKLDEGIGAAEQAAELAPRGSDMWAEAERLVAKAFIEHGRALEADRRIERALSYQFDHPLSPELHASLLSVRVRGLVDLSQPRDALEVADEATRIARQVNSAKSLMEALEARLFALMQLGDPSEVVASGPQVIEMADAIGDMINATRARINTASSMNLLGLWDDARSILERALFDARERRMRILEAFALHNLGMCEARLGQFDRAMRMERDAYKIADETHAARLRFHARVYEVLFVLWKAQSIAAGGADIGRDLAFAAGLTRSLEDIAKTVPVLSVTSSFVSAEVNLAMLAAGDSSAAEAALVAALDAHNKLLTSPVEEWEEATYLSLVEAFIARGDGTNADHALETAFRTVLARSQRITRQEHRTTYLTRIPEIARILALARKRLQKTIPVAPGAARIPTQPPPSGRVAETLTPGAATERPLVPTWNQESMTPSEPDLAPVANEDSTTPSDPPEQATLPPQPAAEEPKLPPPPGLPAVRPSNRGHGGLRQANNPALGLRRPPKPSSKPPK